MEEGVLVEVGIGAQVVGRGAVAEDGPDGGTEGLRQVEVDAAHGPVEVDLLVHEEPGREEHLERGQARLVEGQAPLRDEGVAAQPLGVHRPRGDAGEVGVPAHVVEVVDREDARQEGLQPADPAWHRRILEGRLGDEERHPAWVDRLALGERVAGGDPVARSPSQAGDQGRQLPLDDELGEILVGERLPVGPAPVRGRREGGQDVIVEEMGEGAVADVVEQPRNPQRLHDQPFGRRPQAGVRHGQGVDERRIEVAAPKPGLVHHAEPVREPRVLRGREDPARALQLADPAQALEPDGIEDVLLGRLLGRHPGGLRLGGGEPLRQLDVAVDGIADEVDGGEAGRAHGAIVAAPGRRGRAVGQGTQTDMAALVVPRFRARSRARTFSQ